MFSLPLQEPEGDRDEADQKDRCSYKDDHVRRYGVHGRDDRRETFRICFGLGLTSDYRLIAKKAGQTALHAAPKSVCFLCLLPNAPSSDRPAITAITKTTSKKERRNFRPVSLVSLTQINVEPIERK
jgi:hypothetical protein